MEMKKWESKSEFVKAQLGFRSNILEGFDKYIESNSLINLEEEDDYDENIDSSGHVERLPEAGRQTLLWTDCGSDNPEDSGVSEEVYGK